VSSFSFIQIKVSREAYKKLGELKQELGVQSYRQVVEELVKVYEKWKALQQRLEILRRELGAESYEQVIEELIRIYKMWRSYREAEELLEALENIKTSLNTIRRLLGMQTT
jgi:predicted CopG family antitoxin